MRQVNLISFLILNFWKFWVVPNLLTWDIGCTKVNIFSDTLLLINYRNSKHNKLQLNVLLKIFWSWHEQQHVLHNRLEYVPSLNVQDTYLLLERDSADLWLCWYSFSHRVLAALMVCYYSFWLGLVNVRMLTLSAPNYNWDGSDWSCS